MKRRTFLQGTVASGAIAVAAGAGLLKPTRAMAASAWSTAAFEAKDVAGGAGALFGGDNAKASGDIKIKAPLQAENGAVVPLKVETSIADVENISIFVEKNPSPLATSVALGAGATGYYSTRVKMGKTSNIVVYVKAKGGVFKQHALVKVTVGGCGG
jgi:sulfur-oxidizing protein SoxY